jgi:osmotically-inducible protein OsmY
MIWGKNPVKIAIGSVALSMIAIIGGCSTERTKAPDVTADIQKALDQAGLKDVSVKQDRDKGVVTLGGHVPSDDGKAQAESIAKSSAGNQVVADEIAVLPPNAEGDAKKVNGDLDEGIEKNLDAALVQNHWKKNVSYSVKNGVVTMKGHVASQAARSQLGTMAAQIPNVTQVVNELDVRYGRATSSR